MKGIEEEQDFGKVECPPGTIRLDVACGQNKREGFVGIDKWKGEGVDIGYDLTIYPWPFTNNSVYEVYCSHYVEHVQDLKSFMEEVYRITVPLGTVTIIAPYYTSIRACQDYTHVRGMTELSMNYFDQEWLKAAKLSHYDVECDFEVLGIKYFYNAAWQGRAEEALRWAAKHHVNVIDDIMYSLRKRVQ